ncbi:MaoC family dehydratase [Brevibacterium picturae]|uniref:(R)-specific enoyl-CoA hydratase RipB/Ich n=1 Tax=Brevibacterium picturae TaxID=260553 RepID=A0ABP4MSE7_9MICO
MTTHTGWHGRYFEDFVVGDVYEHPLGRTVTTTDNMWFTLLTQNTAPVHFDHEYAKKTEFGQPLVNSAFTLSLVTGQTVGDVSQNVFANLAWDKITLPKPVFEGDTLHSRTTVRDRRESSSRPSVGIVSVATEGLNQRGEIVVSFERTVMVYRRGFGPRAEASAPTTAEEN